MTARFDERACDEIDAAVAKTFRAIQDKYLDKDTREAMERIVGYLEMDELKDYQCRPKDEQPGHIYEDVIRLREWLEANKGV